MSERKGLSQILYLIIAASVLMMVALSLIFMFNSSVGGSTGDLAACRNTASAQCQVTPAEEIDAPSSCVVDGTPLEGASFVDDKSSGDGHKIDCEDVE